MNVIFVLSLLAAPPVTGRAVAPYDTLDAIVLDGMKTTGATAAQLTVLRGREPLVIRGYGWSDRALRNATTHEATFRIGSNTKPFTSAAVRHLVENSDLTLDSKILPLLPIRPLGGNFGDERLKNVTIRHLLTHRGGWDRDQAFDPMYRLDEILKKTRPRKTFEPSDVIRYMWAEPMQFAPGSRRAYSNFGYVLLGEILERQTGRSYLDVVNETIAEPIGINDLAISHRAKRARPPREVAYPDDRDQRMRVRRAAGGLTTSATSLCRFMETYWVDGRPRNGGRASYYHTGSLPGTTTAIMVQRRDGINWALLFNRRRDDTYNEDAAQIQSDVTDVLDKIARESRP